MIRSRAFASGNKRKAQTQSRLRNDYCLRDQNHYFDAVQGEQKWLWQIHVGAEY
jgi:hypothetical protein